MIGLIWLEATCRHPLPSCYILTGYSLVVNLNVLVIQRTGEPSLCVGHHLGVVLGVVTGLCMW